MGLCLGFSLLSVVELIYFFTLRWCVLCCRRKGGGGGGIQNMVIWVVKFSRGRNTKLEGDSQNLRPINVRFPTLSNHFFFWQLHTRICLNKLKFRRSFWGAEQVYFLIGSFLGFFKFVKKIVICVLFFPFFAYFAVLRVFFFAFVS